MIQGAREPGSEGAREPGRQGAREPGSQSQQAQNLRTFGLREPFVGPPKKIFKGPSSKECQKSGVSKKLTRAEV